MVFLMRITRFILVGFLLIVFVPLHAQLSLGSNPQPATPQAAEMTRYGEHNANPVAANTEGTARSTSRHLPVP